MFLQRMKLLWLAEGDQSLTNVKVKTILQEKTTVIVMIMVITMMLVKNQDYNNKVGDDQNEKHGVTDYHEDNNDRSDNEIDDDTDKYIGNNCVSHDRNDDDDKDGRDDDPVIAHCGSDAGPVPSVTW
ncbi:hypothetical protein PsorP6_006019 [Peronosclerospora sorghi]|uniref:Uncharacterized protein n=1 Tax=Peronosclerospora sorghi TaxID=230839 RepID=A0ACC0W4L2_9STRA|nr:hypothetical protein PsorP6_006019 [Peronosclerospora sorghi]